MTTHTVSVAFPTLQKTTWIEKNVELLSKDKNIIEFIYEEGTKPVSQARQNILEKAKGDYILWIDDDVELHENPLPKLFKHLNENVAGVAASTIELDKTYYMNETHRRLLPPIYKKMKSSFNCGLYDRKKLLEINGFNTSLVAGEDNDVNVRLRKKGKEIIGIRDLIVTHHSSRNFEKELGYFQGIKYLYNTYGFFENECSQITVGKIKTNIIKFQVSPAEFFKEKKKSIIQRIYGKENAIYQLYDNLIYWINPELRKPRNVGLLVTENCFFRCKSCTFWKEKKPETDLATMKHIIDKIAAFGIPSITLVGGEPLSRPDIGEIIQYIKDKKIECT
ncbi:MAG: glycosyltransferase, partial [Candidatus Woesearchaeota archaeon]